MLVGDLLRTSARRQPAKVALCVDDEALTYAELDLAANRFANAVLTHGLGKGDHILVMAQNCIEYPVLHFGAARTGCVLVHVSPLSGPFELQHILDTLKPRLIVVSATERHKITDLLPDRDRATIVVLGDSPAAGATTLAHFCAGSASTEPRVAIDAHDPFAITFTGGTTGLPKGAVVTHSARVLSALTTALAHGVERHDVLAVVTPLYHVVSMLIWMQAGILVGTTCVVQRKWDVERFEALLARHRISTVFMVPTQLRAILAHEGFEVGAYRTLRQIGCGGAILPVELKRDCLAMLPHVTLNDHYGQSETGLLTLLNANIERDKLETVGQPAAGVELSVVDEQGRPLPPGQTGAVVARGDFLFSGYHANPEENALFFKGGNGWGWTGDLGYLDSDGYLTIVGRSKEMVVSGGVNIYPREVERVLEEMPAVIECAAFGVPDDKWGEAIVACVVKRTDTLSEHDVITYCEARIAKIKRPKYVWFVDEIAKTPSGKIKKSGLRHAFLDTALYQPRQG